MTVEELARQPIFTASIVICALVITYAVVRCLSALTQGAVRTIANASISPIELESIELAGNFHEDLEQLILWVVSIEKLSAELPGPFDDHSWIRLLELIDTLEMIRNELNAKLQESNFTIALPLSRYLTGQKTTPPEISLPNGKQIHSVSHWQDTSHNLLLRMLSRIEDSLTYGSGGNPQEISDSFRKNLANIKEDVLQGRD